MVCCDLYVLGKSMQVTRNGTAQSLPHCVVYISDSSLCGIFELLKEVGMLYKNAPCGLYDCILLLLMGTY